MAQLRHCCSPEGIPAPPVLVKAEVTPVKKAVPSQFPLLERVKGKSSEQLKALEESFQRSSSPSQADLGKAHSLLARRVIGCLFECYFCCSFIRSATFLLL